MVADGTISALKTSKGDVLSPDSVVLATGDSSSSMARIAGAFAPVYPVKGYVIEARCVAFQSLDETGRCA